MCPFYFSDTQFLLVILVFVPKLTKLQCWNHIFRDVWFWLQKYKAPAKEIAIYLDDILQMFHSTSEAEYMERLEEYSKFKAAFL